MKNVIKGQAAILVALLTAFAVTLTACGGGSSSAGGGGAIKSASVSGTVTGNGLASLEIRSTNSLIAAVSDVFIPVAHAAGIPGVVVSVICAGSSAAFQDMTDAEGKFKVNVNDIGSGICSTTFDGAPGPDVNIALGMETEVTVILNSASGAVNLVSMSQKDDDSTEIEIKVDDGLGGDDCSSGTSSDDSSSGISSDDSSSGSSNSGSGSSNSGSGSSNSGSG